MSNRQNGSIGASSVSSTIAEDDLPHSGANDSDSEEEVEPDRSEERIQQSIEADAQNNLSNQYNTRFKVIHPFSS